MSQSDSKYPRYLTECLSSDLLTQLRSREDLPDKYLPLYEQWARLRHEGRLTAQETADLLILTYHLLHELESHLCEQDIQKRVEARLQQLREV